LSFLEAAAHMLEERGGFKTAIWRLNASGQGVPQDRLRYFLIASATGELPIPPSEEYQDYRQDFDVDALPPVTLQEAIFDLPPRAAGEGLAVEACATAATNDSRARRYLTKFRLLSASRLLFNHTVRYHNPRDLELYSLLRPGEDSIHILERHGRADLMRYRRDVFDDKYARLRGDRPSKTIVAHLAKDGNGYVHPTQVRSISIREAARLQSFRDDYAFCGSPSDQWTQVGNAVPPVLAERIAGSFLQVLKRRERP
jgi:DNA (cytosine-5)-methyltransferase 1